MALNGTQALLALLRGKDQRVKDAAARALGQAAEVVLGDSQALCPVSPTNEYFEGTDKNGKKLKGDKRPKNPLYRGGEDGTGGSGDLVRSGVTDPIVITASLMFVRVKYTAAHAAAVHEVPDARHGAALQKAFPQAHIPNLQGRWKYLAIPLILREDWALQYVATAIKGAIGA